MWKVIIRAALLILGGVVIVASLLFTVTHLQDGTVATVLLPGVLLGLALIGVYIGSSNRCWP